MVDLYRKYEKEKKIKEKMEEAAIENAPLLAEEGPIGEEEATSTNNRIRGRVWKRGEDVSGKVWKREGGKKKRWKRLSSWVWKKGGEKMKRWRRLLGRVCKRGGKKKKIVDILNPEPNSSLKIQTQTRPYPFKFYPNPSH